MTIIKSIDLIEWNYGDYSIVVVDRLNDGRRWYALTNWDLVKNVQRIQEERNEIL